MEFRAFCLEDYNLFENFLSSFSHYKGLSTPLCFIYLVSVPKKKKKSWVEEMKEIYPYVLKSIPLMLLQTFQILLSPEM